LHKASCITLYYHIRIILVLSIIMSGIERLTFNAARHMIREQIHPGEVPFERSMQMKTVVIALSFLLVFMFGCGADKSKSSDSGSTQPSPGRPDTRGIEAATAVGYDGAAMRRSVDKALNQNDARNAEQQKAIEQVNGK